MKLNSMYSNNASEMRWCPCQGSCGLTCAQTCTGCKGTCADTCFGKLMNTTVSTNN